MHRQDPLAGGTHVGLPRAVQRVREIAADHRLHDPRAIEGAGVIGDDMLAVAQHRDPVGEQQGLLDRVRDEDDRDPALLQRAHEVEEVVLLLGGQRRRRLVENDDLRLMQHRARDLDHLLLGGAEQPDGRGRRHVEIQRLQELLGGDVDAAQPVVEFLLTEKQVLRDRHARHQAVLLEHHGDAEMPRLQRSLRRGLDAVDEHRA